MATVIYSIADQKSKKAGEEMKSRAYAHLQLREVMSLKAFSKHVSNHGSNYSRADIEAVLTLVTDCLLEMLREGKKVQLGDLGSFYPILSSEGAESKETFTSRNIRRLYAGWERGKAFKDFKEEVDFTLVPTRKAQQATTQAQKQGATTVDLMQGSTAAGGSTGSGGSGGTTGGSSTGGGSGSDPDNGFS